MKLILALILVTLFLGLAIIHFYWALGGQWALKKAVPVNHQGEPLFKPGKLDCVIVGIGLLFCGILYLSLTDWIELVFPFWFKNSVLWIIPIAFTLRALGDFNYVGFFKKVKSSEFATMDTKFYSPLCLLMGAIGFLLAA